MSNISELLASLGAALTTVPDGYGLAHTVGHALPSLDDASLRELRNQLVQVEPEDPQVNAIAAALIEIVDGYRLGRQQTVTLSLREGINRAVLCALEQRAATTGELAKQLAREESQISRAIARLRKLDLIDPPLRDPADRRRIEHRLSLSAKHALGRLDQRARKAEVWQLSTFESLEARTIPVDETIEPAMLRLSHGRMAHREAPPRYIPAKKHPGSDSTRVYAANLAFLKKNG